MVWWRGIAGRGERAAGVVVETSLGMGSESSAGNVRPEYDGERRKALSTKNCGKI